MSGTIFVCMQSDVCCEQAWLTLLWYKRKGYCSLQQAHLQYVHHNLIKEVKVQERRDFAQVGWGEVIVGWTAPGENTKAKYTKPYMVLCMYVCIRRQTTGNIERGSHTHCHDTYVYVYIIHIHGHYVYIHMYT